MKVQLRLDSLFYQILVILAGLILSACASDSSLRIENVERSLAAINSAIENGFPGGIRSRSSNGRELYSYPISPESMMGDVRGVYNFPERALARAIVLGDRRPYDIEILVRLEVKNKSGQYNFKKMDKAMADRLRKKILDNLNKSQGESDLIDGFKPF